MKKNSHRNPSIQQVEQDGTIDTSNPKVWTVSDMKAAKVVMFTVELCGYKIDELEADKLILFRFDSKSLNEIPNIKTTLKDVASVISKLHRMIRHDGVNQYQKNIDNSLQSGQEIVVALCKEQLQDLARFVNAAIGASSSNSSRHRWGSKKASRLQMPELLKYANNEVCDNSYKVLDNICAFIPEINLHQRDTDKQSKLGWRCWQTNEPGIIAATLALKPTNIITAVGLGEMISNLFKESGIKAKVSFDTKSQCQTLCIAYKMDKLNRIDQTTFREQLGHQVIDVAKEYIAHYFPGQFGHEPPSL